MNHSSNSTAVRRLLNRPAALIVLLLFTSLHFGAPVRIHASLPGRTQPEPHNFEVHPKLKKGSFLIATKGMGDPNFAGTVILMLDYGLRGAVGLIINRPNEELDASEALPQVKSPPDTIYYGGPVEMKRLRILIRADTPPGGARHIFEDVYESLNLDLLERLIDGSVEARDFHVYNGYSGWFPMQLDRELSSEGWRVLGGDVEAIFSANPAGVWLELIHSKTPNSPTDDLELPSSTPAGD